MPAQRSRPLEGVKVVELASFMSGPFATMMLADLGADVIKVEPPTGDPFRRFGRAPGIMSAIFVNANRGKRSIVLDLKQKEEQHELQRLLTDADVMICNWRPSVAPRLGVDDEVIAEQNPGLVRVYVTGFGSEGPDADSPTFDAVVQGRLGLGEAFGDGERPRLAATYLVDKVAAAMVCQATLAALVARARDGVGDKVEISLLEAASYWTFPDVFSSRTLLDHQPPDARNRQAAAVRPIQASDGWIVVVPVTGGQVRRACAVVGCAEASDELLAVRDPADLTTRVSDTLEKVTVSKPVAHWLDAFARADVPAGPCLTLDGHFEDEQVKAQELYAVHEWGDLGPVRHIRYPATFGQYGPLFAPGRPPLVGEHTDEVRAHGFAGDRAHG